MKKGFVIILVLAVLLLLSLMIITYVTLQLTNKNISRNYLDSQRARLLAESGLSYALGKLTTEDPFGDQAVCDQDPLTITKNPSFKTGLVRINGQEVGYSGITGDTYGQNSDMFTLKVKDANSMIYVNDGLGNKWVTKNLARLINELARHNNVIGSSAPANIGDIITERRPASGYQSINELKSVLETAYPGNGSYYLEKLRPFLTTHAWVDNNVANPVPLSTEVLSGYKVPYNTEINVGGIASVNRFRYGRTPRGSDLATIPPSQFTDITSVTPLKYADEFSNPVSELFHGIEATDVLNPQYIEIVSRAPVNVNSASEEVLITLLKDLKGFFVSERAGGTIYPAHYMNMVWFMARLQYIRWYQTNNTFPDGAEIGVLYSTEAISYDPLTDSGMAKSIAIEIRNCREKLADYSDFAPTPLWFRGTFKTWRQFNAFCDYLVTKEVIKDSRSIFYEFKYRYFENYFASGIPIVPDMFIPSAYNKKVLANKAIADTLKANFNPNLHLNELNPDSNIDLRVDKTDLIVNSTEFCFTLMGYFQIESLGRILRPLQGTDSLASGVNNTVISDYSINAVAKVFDVYRQTNQAHFLKGNLPEPSTLTNNGYTLEICPVPNADGNHKIIALDNEWEGYITLPAYKYQDLGAALIAHYTTTFKLDKHATLETVNLKPKKLQRDKNNPDRTEITGVYSITESATFADAYELIGKEGPYPWYPDASDLDRHRLCRSFRTKINDPTGQALYYAPSDLRVDGAYVERYSNLAYIMAPEVFANSGVTSYWLKPFYRPEMASRDRCYFSVSFIYSNDYSNTGVDEEHRLFAHLFLSSHNWYEGGILVPGGSLTDPQFEWGSPAYTQECSGAPFNPNRIGCSWTPLNWSSDIYYRPISFIFGFSTPDYTKTTRWQGGGIGKMSPSLNHYSHTDLSNINYLKKGQWMHVALQWDIAAQSTNMYVNGILMDASASVYNISLHPYFTSTGADIFLKNRDYHIRMGNAPKDAVENSSSGDRLGYRHNWTCDSTIDEFYIWTSSAVTNAISMWQSGRYLRPEINKSNFISENLASALASKQILASASQIPAPSATGASGNIADSQIRILGLSWTWYGEGVDNNNGKPYLHDFKNYQNAEKDNATTRIFPNVKINLLIDGVEQKFGGYEDDGFASTGEIIATSSNTIQYKVLFDVPVGSDTVLLYSPVFDDITIYYTNGCVFVSYICG